MNFPLSLLMSFAGVYFYAGAPARGWGDGAGTRDLPSPWEGNHSIHSWGPPFPSASDPAHSHLVSSWETR